MGFFFILEVVGIRAEAYPAPAGTAPEKEFAMSSKEIKPWWERVNDYYLFEERQEFTRGAVGYRPNNRQESMMAQLIAGYVPNQHDIPKPFSKRNEQPKK